MNSSFKSANLNLSESFYLKIGSTWTFDSIYIHFISPLSFIAMILNMLSLFIITKIRIKNATVNFYEYLKVNLINGIVMCLIGGFVFVGYSPRYFPLSLSLIGRVYRCFIFNVLASSFYLFANMINLLILLDRLSIFIIRLKFYLKLLSPYKQMGLMFLFCVFVNWPLFFWNYIKQDDEFYSGALDVENLNSFTFCGRTDFYKSLFGKIVSVVSFFIQDGIELALEVSLNVFTIVYYIRFIKNKPTTLNPQNNRRNQENTRTTSSDRKLVIMTLYLSSLSIIAHMIALVRSIIILNNSVNPSVSFMIILLGVLSKGLSQFSNFFIFYIFNRNFRNAFKKLFSCL